MEWVQVQGHVGGRFTRGCSLRWLASGLPLARALDASGTSGAPSPPPASGSPCLGLKVLRSICSTFAWPPIVIAAEVLCSKAPRPHQPSWGLLVTASSSGRWQSLCATNDNAMGDMMWLLRGQSTRSSLLNPHSYLVKVKQLQLKKQWNACAGNNSATTISMAFCK